MIESIPIPGIEDFDRAYWKNCSQNILSIQHCADCKQPRFPPRHMCPKCQSIKDEWNIENSPGTIQTVFKPKGVLPSGKCLI